MDTDPLQVSHLDHLDFSKYNIKPEEIVVSTVDTWCEILRKPGVWLGYTAALFAFCVGVQILIGYKYRAEKKGSQSF